LCYVLFSGLSWNLIQNTWIRPENTSRAIWSFSEFEIDPEKMKNRLRHFNRSIICTANNSIDLISVDPTSIDPDAIDRFSEHHKSDRSTFDRSTSHLPKGQDISKYLCDPNWKLSSMDRNWRRPALFVWPKLVLDGFFCKSKFLYIWNCSGVST
jgi:hypothetical protein